MVRASSLSSPACDTAFLILHLCSFLWGSSSDHPNMRPRHRSTQVRNGLTLSGVAFTKDQTPWPHEITPHIFGITAKAHPLPGKLDEGLFSPCHIQGGTSATVLGHQLCLPWPEESSLPRPQESLFAKRCHLGPSKPVIQALIMWKLPMISFGEFNSYPLRRLLGQCKLGHLVARCFLDTQVGGRGGDLWKDTKRSYGSVCQGAEFIFPFSFTFDYSRVVNQIPLCEKTSINKC